MFIVSFPYAVHQGGYWAIFAMLAVAGICCYTGKILVECLYVTGKDGVKKRVRTSYGEIAEQVLGKWMGKVLVSSAQVIELLMTCILYVLLAGELLKGSFSTKSMPLSAWICLSTIPLLFCSFLKTMRRVSFLSLWCSIAHMFINIMIILYCLTLVHQWQPLAVKINPNIWTVPISLGIIVFSYTSQIFLPTLEGKMVRRERFNCMMHCTHIAAAVFKAVFSYIGYITWGENTQEVITNNLPRTLKIAVNVILVVKALLSYPLPYFAAVEIIEKAFFDKKTIFPSCYRENVSIKWWGIGLRALLVIATTLLAIFIPHFALLMGLIGNFTGTTLSFILPCVFYLSLKRDELHWYSKLWLLFIIFLGTLSGSIGIYYSFRALVLAFQGRSVIPWSHTNSFSKFDDMAANETLQISIMGG
ncbi:vesicular inhibitory amino acid transporter-like [Watersipora subatra]|uniref:vesicular inhibitory amino acid transporter-like n=1 Tax=Watersipora subatra TaxID=2589382 RepID=UPI00355BF3E9